MRKPTVENKYNLKPKDIQKAVVLDYEKLHKEPFWRNDVIQAWCLSDCVRPNPKDHYGTFDLEYWIGFYDNDAKKHRGKIKFHCTSYGGMCGYDFKNFFDGKEIENEYDLMLQEKLLSRINWLIDEKIIEIKK
jgi:hypothetical protein